MFNTRFIKKTNNIIIVIKLMVKIKTSKSNQINIYEAITWLINLINKKNK